MFTTFLLGILGAVSALMLALLLRPAQHGQEDDRIPYVGLAVLGVALALGVWGLSLLG